ncbi:MAG: hypothetical protein C0504_03870 [Candidatus Solibacter sp.]|nr:hypothetical protein [Candidatus Solibacter sp.]
MDAAVVAGGDEQGSVGGEGERPDVFRLGVIEFADLGAGDFEDTAVGGSSGVDSAARVDGEGEDFGLGGGPDGRGLAVGGDAIKASAVAGAEVERAVGGGSDAPDAGFTGREESIEAGGEGEAAVAGERDAGEAATDEVGERVGFPTGGAAGEGEGGGQQEDGEDAHDLFHRGH